MKVFVPANNKGGVGKTNTAALFAEYASIVLNKRVLAIDFDPQCNFSQRYLVMETDPSYQEGHMPPIHPDYDPLDEEYTNWDGRSSIADFFYGKEVVPYPTSIINLDILPGHADKLLTAEHVRKNEVVQKVHNRMKEFVNLPELKEIYDLIVIDTAPSKGPLTISAVKAATHMLIPTVMEDKPIQGVYGMIQLWMQESLTRDPNNKLDLIGILANKYDARTVLHRELYLDLQKREATSKYLLKQKIGQRIVFAELDSSNSSVFHLPDDNLAKNEAMDVCKFIAERIFK